MGSTFVTNNRANHRSDAGTDGNTLARPMAAIVTDDSTGQATDHGTPQRFRPKQLSLATPR
jgi:hypothetical protein